MREEMENRLKEEAGKLLKEGKVDYIVGYGKGSVKFRTSPLITNKEEELENLVINPFIANNLSRYPIELKARVGIVVKGCDSRSLISLIQDKKVNREDVVILGVPCEGVVDIKKIEKHIGKDIDRIEEIKREGENLTIQANGSNQTLSFKDAIFDKCLGCEYPTPLEYDVLLGTEISPKPDMEKSLMRIKELENMDATDRWSYWREEFSKCIRCYGCKNVCPACFCERCFIDVNIPQWVNTYATWQDNLVFQLIRTLHVAGRCSDCGECERACPVGIPLRSLQRKMQEEVKALFGHEAGVDKDALPVFTHYEDTDPEEFIK
jgi:ferredoxin